MFPEEEEEGQYKQERELRGQDMEVCAGGNNKTMALRVEFQSRPTARAIKGGRGPRSNRRRASLEGERHTKKLKEGVIKERGEGGGKGIVGENGAADGKYK